MKTMIGYDTDHPSFDRGRYIRQLRGCIKWKKAGARNTIEAATGYGKSATALILIV